MRKFLLIILGGLIIATVVFAGWLTLNEQKIIKAFVNKANPYLVTPISTGHIDLNIWEDFPSIALSISNVKIQERHKDSKASLAEVQELKCLLNPFQLLGSEVVIQKLILKDGFLQLKDFNDGTNNYKIIKPSESNGELLVTIKDIQLKGVDVNYAYKDQRYFLRAQNLTSELSWKDQIYDILISGQFSHPNFQLADFNLKKNWSIDSQIGLTYDHKSKALHFGPSTLSIEDGDFKLWGDMTVGQNEAMHLRMEGVDLQGDAVLAILSNADTGLGFKQKDGSLSFTAFVKRKKGEERPEVNMHFQSDDLALTTRGMNNWVSQLNMKGSFSNGVKRGLSTSLLNVESFRGQFLGHLVKGNLKAYDLNDPRLMMEFEGEVPAKFLNPLVKGASFDGKLDLDFRLKSLLGGRPEGKTYEKYQANGQVVFEDFSYEGSSSAVKQLNGQLDLASDRLVFKNVSGQYLGESFDATGVLMNPYDLIHSKEQPINLQASIKLDEFNTANYLTDDSGESITKNNEQVRNSKLQLKIEIGRFKHNNLEAKNVKGSIELSDKKLDIHNLKADFAGGFAEVDGQFILGDKYAFSGKTSVNQIQLDQTFESFDNFEQGFIQANHLRGAITATSTTYFDLSPNFELDFASFHSDIDFEIFDGELIDFDPIKDLEAYIKDRTLDHVYFERLQNNITIKDEQVLIPDMTISSNVNTFRVTGTHNFDQQINYALRLPMASFFKQDPDEYFGAVEDDGTGAKVFISITGTTDDYKIGIDKKATRKKISADFKKAGIDIKKLFKKEKDVDKKAVKVRELNTEEVWEH